MLQPLPAETVFEAKRRSRRNTWLLFALLAAVYLVIFNLMGYTFAYFSTEGASTVTDEARRAIDVPRLALWSSLTAIAAALLHFVFAWFSPLSGLLNALGAQPADEKDELHKRLLNVVEEARLASGLDALQAVVMHTPAMNAFSVEDARGQKVIGITEGLLSRLTRAELEAVIAHEAAHLAHGDSRVVATACTLFSVFFILSRVLQPGRFRSSRGRGGGGAAAILIVWLLALIGYFIARVISMAISRNREYLADGHAVHMCKDPLALAGALKKISTADRAGLTVPEGFSPAFIMNPQYAALDEGRGFLSDLFSTHPPVEERLEKLMKWARQEAPGTPASAGQVYVKSEESAAWKGPMSPEAAVQQGQAGPTSWIADGTHLNIASAQPVLYREFVQKLAASASKHDCPRCGVPLVSNQYEGMPILDCRYCGGHLLYAEGLEKAISRRLEKFDHGKMSEAAEWRKRQRGAVGDLCKLPFIKCPFCGTSMFKRIFTELTRVIVDRCQNETCRAVWCDAGELEYAQLLVEASDPAEKS